MLRPQPVLRVASATIFFWSLAISSWASGDALHVDLGGGVLLELVEIAPGQFTQGSKDSEPGHQADEVQREVRLTKKFYLGKYPVTFSQFERFVKDANYKTEAEKGSSGGYGWTPNGLKQQKGYDWRNPGFPQTPLHPVTLVTYNDAKTFLNWLSRKSGREFQLPTEAQWEYACRAGTKTAWPNGDDPAASDALAWNKVTASSGTMPVGRKPLNSWGLGDTLGNVWEWCEDWYGPYESGPVTDPVQTNPKLSDKPRRVLRGGSFARDRIDCRPTARYRNDPASRNPDNGFRVMTFEGDAASSPNPAAAPAKPAAPPVEVEAPDRAKGAGLPASGPPWVVRADMGSWFGLPIVAVVVIIIWSFISRLLRGSGLSSMGSGSGLGLGAGGRVFTRIGDDGFWITGVNVPPGTPLHCRYVANGAEQDIHVAFEPGPDGQFIYTGQRPSNVTVLIGGQGTSFPGPVVRNVVTHRYDEPFVTETPHYTPPSNPPAY